jgi:hypothetical protein
MAKLNTFRVPEGLLLIQSNDTEFLYDLAVGSASWKQIEGRYQLTLLCKHETPWLTCA